MTTTTEQQQRIELNTRVARAVFGDDRDFGQRSHCEGRQVGIYYGEYEYGCVRCGRRWSVARNWPNAEPTDSDRTGMGPCVLNPLPYGEAIVYAWQVVEKMRERGLDCRIVTQGPREVLVEFWDDMSVTPGSSYGWTDIADTAPLAICRAALKALEATSVP